MTATGLKFVSQRAVKASTMNIDALLLQIPTGATTMADSPAFSRVEETEHSDQEQSNELAHVQDAIESSRYILELKDDWDEDGSARYTEAVWDRAVQFLLKYANSILETQHVRIDAPQILPGPNGSIDLHWKNSDYELLINIPADPSKPAGFYGDDYESSSIKGTFDPSKYNYGLLLWLTKKK